MYVVLYSFVVKPNHEDQFLEAWKGLTALIYKHEDSLGSRLHKKEDLNFIAYAQWPSKIIFDNAGQHLPEEANTFKNGMKASCIKIEILNKLEVIEDLLKENLSE